MAREIQFVIDPADRPKNDPAVKEVSSGLGGREPVPAPYASRCDFYAYVCCQKWECPASVAHARIERTSGHANGSAELFSTETELLDAIYSPCSSCDHVQKAEVQRDCY